MVRRLYIALEISKENFSSLQDSDVKHMIFLFACQRIRLRLRLACHGDDDDGCDNHGPAVDCSETGFLIGCNRQFCEPILENLLRRFCMAIFIDNGRRTILSLMYSKVREHSFNHARLLELEQRQDTRSSPTTLTRSVSVSRTPPTLLIALALLLLFPYSLGLGFKDSAHHLVDSIGFAAALSLFTFLASIRQFGASSFSR